MVDMRFGKLYLLRFMHQKQTPQKSKSILF
jgi:hypothetical protein